MISKSQIKLITSLHQKKYRDKHKLFLAEGPKVISDLLAAGHQPEYYFSTEEQTGAIPNYQQVTEKELQRLSALKTAHNALAVFRMPEPTALKTSGLTVALDAVRDPGNLGTIIRLCDWFGVIQLVCSPDTADCYNPKVIQATMGSIARVAVHYTDLPSFLNVMNYPVFGAVMDGESVYNEMLPQDAVVVLGNEGRGISEPVMATLSNRITIPAFGDAAGAESLNVATATAILLSEFRRATER